jgi:hypothetical protein
LLGAAEGLREASPTHLPPYPLQAYEHGLDELRASMAVETFRKAWAEGRAMTPDEAMAHALETTPW